MPSSTRMNAALQNAGGILALAVPVQLHP